MSYLAFNKRTASHCIAVLLLLSTSAGISSKAQSLSGPATERVLRNRLHERVPVKIKLREDCEASFKDLNNHTWPSHFAIEVTNTGDKPIYYLALFLRTNSEGGTTRLMGEDEDKRAGHLVIDVRYGNNRFGDIVTKANSEDVPLIPGQTVVLTCHEGEAAAIQRGFSEGREADPTRVDIILSVLSFGDGTGLWGVDAMPYPPLNKRK